MSRFAVRDSKISGTDLKSIAAVIEGSREYSAADSRCDRYVAWRNVFRAASRTRDTEGFFNSWILICFFFSDPFSSRPILFHKLRDYDIFRHRRFCSGGFGMENRKYILPVIMLAIFETVAVTLWLTKDNLFYLFNFSYIGLSISLGVFLFFRKYKYARRIVQLLVGLYMLIYLGLICGENMQIEGFWYYLFTGVFEAATIHYAIAKIFGPLLFGRGWCGYACWTAMVLDFLPYKIPTRPRKKIAWIRYLTFMASFLFVAALFLAKAGKMERVMFWAFIIGNAAYYALGIALAIMLKDNRAFCKYICPITVFLKPMSYFSLIRVSCDKEKCISCGKCKKLCPMDVDVTDNSRKRKNGTECILCMECVRNCPKDAL